LAQFFSKKRQMIFYTLVMQIVKKIGIFTLGLIAFLWFVIRVIPKPSRAAYPCQKALFPFAASFVIWVTGVISSAIFFRKAKLFKL